MASLTGVSSFRLQDGDMLGQSSPDKTGSEASFHDARSAPFPRSASMQSLSTCMSFPLKLRQEGASNGSEDDPEKQLSALQDHAVEDYARQVSRHEPPDSPPCSKRTKSSYPSVPAHGFTAPMPATSKDHGRLAVPGLSTGPSMDSTAAACPISQRAHAQISVIHEGVVEFRLRLSPPFLFGASNPACMRPASQGVDEPHSSPAPHPSPIVTFISSTPPSHVGCSTGMQGASSPPVFIHNANAITPAEDEAISDIQGPALSGSPVQYMKDQTHKQRWANPLTKSFKELFSVSLFTKFNVVPPPSAMNSSSAAAMKMQPSTAAAAFDAASATRQIRVNVAYMAPDVAVNTAGPVEGATSKPAVLLGDTTPIVLQTAANNMLAAAGTGISAKDSMDGVGQTSNNASSILTKQPSDLTAALGMVTGRRTCSAAGEHISTDGGASMPELHASASPDRPFTSGGGGTEEPARCSTPERLPGSDGGSKPNNIQLQLRSMNDQIKCISDGSDQAKEQTDGSMPADAIASDSPPLKQEQDNNNNVGLKESSSGDVTDVAPVPLTFGIRNDTAAAVITAARRAAATKKAYKVMTRVVRKMLPSFKGMYGSGSSSMGGSNAASTEGVNAPELMNLIREQGRIEDATQAADVQAVLLGKKRKAEVERFPEDEGRWAPDAPASRVSQALASTAVDAVPTITDMQSAPVILSASPTCKDFAAGALLDGAAIKNGTAATPLPTTSAASSEVGAPAAKPTAPDVGTTNSVDSSAATNTICTGADAAGPSTAPKAAATPTGSANTTGVVHVQVLNPNVLEPYTINSPGFEHGAPKQATSLLTPRVLAASSNRTMPAACALTSSLVPAISTTAGAGSGKLGFLNRFLCACFVPAT